MRLRAAAAIGIAATLSLAAGCGGAAPPVRLTDEWPAVPASAYGEIVARWTREARLLHDFDRIVQVHATFKSPQWRSAYVARRAERELMSDQARQELLAEQRADAEGHYEIEMLVSTYEPALNDLQKGDRSAWRVVLVDSNGNEIAPESIERDRRDRTIIKQFFPELAPFHTPYIARFPKTNRLEDGDQFSLKVASAQGGVELVWSAR